MPIYLEGNFRDVPRHDHPELSARHGGPSPLVHPLWGMVKRRQEAGGGGGSGSARRQGTDQSGSCDGGAGKRARNRTDHTVHDRTPVACGFWPGLWHNPCGPAPFSIRSASFLDPPASGGGCDLVTGLVLLDMVLRSLAIILMMASCCQGFSISSTTLSGLRSRGASPASGRSSARSALSIGKS